MLPRALHGPAVSILSVVGFVLAWEILVRLFDVPAWLLPAPSDVWSSFLQNLHVIGKHVLATGAGAIGGLVIGSLIGVGVAVCMVHSRLLERILMPLLVIDQSIPKVALAPLFVIWFGAGMTSRVFIAIVISFFPMIVSTARGLTTIDPRLGNLMDTLAANRWEVLVKIRMPNAVPYMFAGLKIAVPLSIIGAVVAEFVQADSGLGFLVLIAVSQVDTPLVFVAVLLMATLSLVAFGIVAAVEVTLLSRRFSYLMPQGTR